MSNTELNMQQQMQLQQMQQRYLNRCHQILGAIVPEDPNFLTEVRTIFKEIIDEMIGAEHAPKVTDKLIDLPIE